LSAGGVNIETAAAYPIGGSTLSVIHLRVAADETQADCLGRKLLRLIDVLEVRTDREEHSVAVELGTIEPLVAAPNRSAGTKV
jgi:hypothetical protein